MKFLCFLKRCIKQIYLFLTAAESATFSFANEQISVSAAWDENLCDDLNPPIWCKIYCKHDNRFHYCGFTKGLARCPNLIFTHCFQLYPKILPVLSEHGLVFLKDFLGREVDGQLFFFLGGQVLKTILRKVRSCVSLPSIRVVQPIFATIFNTASLLATVKHFQPKRSGNSRGGHH